MVKGPEEIISLEEKVSRLARLLDEVGCESAEGFIWRVVIPLAEESGCTILEAIDIGLEDRDGEEYQHFSEVEFALRRIKKEDLEFLK